MKIKPALIRRTLAMLGLDVQTISEQILPEAQDKLLEYIHNIPKDNNERAGLLIIPSADEQAVLIKVTVKADGSFRPVEKPTPIKELLNIILKQFNHNE